MRRQANWTPVIVSNRDLREGETRAARADDVVAAAPTLSALYVTYADPFWDDSTKVLGRRADLRFAAGVAVALALPAIIGLGVYVTAETIMRLAI